MTVPADQVDTEEIKEYLSKHLDEEEMAVPLTDVITEYLGF